MFEPSGDSRMHAAALWDLYQSYLQVGFTDAQAMTMLSSLVYGFAVSAAQRK